MWPYFRAKVIEAFLEELVAVYMNIDEVVRGTYVHIIMLKLSQSPLHVANIIQWYI